MFGWRQVASLPDPSRIFLGEGGPGGLVQILNPLSEMHLSDH